MSDDIILKILLLGDMTVGKTTLLLKYVDNFIPDTYISTMGVDYKMKKIEYKNIEVTLQIWDTAGQERYRALTKSYLKGSDGILFLYDITKKESFDSIKNWIECTAEHSNVTKITVGNKIDMEEKREVTEEMKQNFHKEYDFEDIEISAKKGINVEKVFELLVEKILGDMNRDQIVKKYGRRYSDGSSIVSHLDHSCKKKCC